jgi:hypothetical protein
LAKPGKASRSTGVCFSKQLKNRFLFDEIRKFGNPRKSRNLFTSSLAGIITLPLQSVAEGAAAVVAAAAAAAADDELPHIEQVCA